MLSRENINVLFTSAGRRFDLLRAFRKAYSLLGIIAHAIALDADSLAPALQVADKLLLVPRLDSLEYIPTLTKISRDENATSIPFSSSASRGASPPSRSPVLPFVASVPQAAYLVKIKSLYPPRRRTATSILIE